MHGSGEYSDRRKHKESEMTLTFPTGAAMKRIYQLNRLDQVYAYCVEAA